MDQPWLVRMSSERAENPLYKVSGFAWVHLSTPTWEVPHFGQVVFERWQKRTRLGRGPFQRLFSERINMRQMRKFGRCIRLGAQEQQSPSHEK